MRKKLAILFVALFMFALKITFAAPPQDFQTTQLIGTGLEGPSGFDIAPDGRIFILERTGKVWIYKNGNLLAQPFVDLPSAATGDRGLTGIAFDPDFSTNHWVYFYYTGEDLVNRLVRYDASTDSAQNRTVIYQTSSPSFELHIGGTIRFAADGTMFISIGDNGKSQNAQDLTNPHGKILRINKDGTVPDDNPFVGQPDVLPEIWAYGFRNPFRFTIDSVNGNMYVGDVGDFTWEEINLVEKGGNYGWPICEGVCEDPDFIDPIHAYPHNDESSAVTAGPVYRGVMFPEEYQGDLFFGDYAQGFIKTLDLEEHQHEDGTTHIHVNEVVDFDTAAGSVVDFKQAGDGSIYYITYIPGRLYRITYSTDSSIPVANASADKTGGIEPLTVNFSSEGSYDPDGGELTYLWDFGDGATSTDANPSYTYTEKGAYTVELTVTDDEGNSALAVPITIQVGEPPTIHIGSPEDFSFYRSGDTIFYSASATDSAGFDLHDSDFTTEVIFHHGTHIHPFLGPIVGKSGEFDIPLFGEADVDQWYEIKITATDSNGLSSTESVNIFPETTQISFDSIPTGLDVVIDGILMTSPVTLDTVINYHRVIKPRVLQEKDGIIYTFNNWSDGGSVEHTVAAPETHFTFTASYNEAPVFNAEYFDNPDLAGIPTLERQDKEVSFNWGSGSPDPSIPEDEFSARWEKEQFFAEGRYIFDLTTDDGARLYIDGELVLDKWFNQSATRYRVSKWLAEGNHNIKVEYYDHAFEAVIIMFWELALDQTPPTASPTPTPTTFPTPSPTPTPGVGSQFYSEFWNYDTDPVIPTDDADHTRFDEEVYFNWGEGSPDTTINNDKFVARFRKSEDLTEGTYEFNVLSDDGVRLYVDDELILDQWVDQSPTEYTIQKEIAEGTHTIMVEYFERFGGAVVEMTYENIGSTTTPTPTPTLTPTASPTPTPNPSGDFASGLEAEYYDDKDLSFLAFERIDPNINFDWLFDSPDPSIDPDTFSVRWHGYVEPIYTDTYNFYVVVDDGARLWVDGQVIIEEWSDHSPTEFTSKPISLEAGKKYSIVLEFYENLGSAMSKLLWSSDSQSKEIVPDSQLFHLSDTGPSPTPTPTPTPEATSTPTPTPSPTDAPSEGYYAEFWNLDGSTFPPDYPTDAPDLTRTDESIWFNWGLGSPDPVINIDNFMARWTRLVNFAAGTYRFEVTADDGVRVYIDGNLVIDQWKDQSASKYTHDLTLTAGDHQVVVEYYEHAVDSVIEFQYFPI